jgi:hypothetical protein
MNLKKVILSDISIEAKVSAIAILLDKELPKLTDQVDTVKKLKGEQGDRGLQGEKGNSGRDGKDGKDGRDGKDGSTGKEGKVGEDGVSVTDAKIDFDGSLVISLSSGKELNVGEVVAPDIAEKIKVISTMSTNGAVAILDEGTSITSGVKKINFVGASVTATNSGDDVTVNVSAGTGTVTSVAALTLGTTGTDLSSTVANSTTTPVITLQVPTASATNRGALSSTDWSTFNSKGNGTVTSVGWTGGIVSVGTATSTPAFTIAGTSGGIPYFNSATTWATSATLAANALVIGGGSGVAPSTTTTGTGVVTALGINTGSAGAVIVNGGVLGTPSSGTVTNLTGTASININGTVGATTPTTGKFTNITQSAGTTTVAPITLTSGTNLTTPAAGSWEYDGTAFYATPIASNRAVTVIEHFVARTGTKTMTSNTLLQSIFDNTTGTGGLTSGALTVGASTSYFFEMSINVSAMSATSGNMGFSIVGAGTATFTSAAWHAFGLDSTTQQTGANASTTWQSTVGATGNILNAATGTAASAIVKGIFRINGAGTIIPSIQLTTASAAVIGVNTWFKCYPVGTNTVISVGNWA